MVCRLNMGGKINSDRVNKTVRACILEALLSHPISMSMAHRAVERTEYIAAN